MRPSYAGKNIAQLIQTLFTWKFKGIVHWLTGLRQWLSVLFSGLKIVNSFVSNQQIVSNENGMKSRSHNEYISLTPVKANRIRFPQKQKETEDFFPRHYLLQTARARSGWVCAIFHRTVMLWQKQYCLTLGTRIVSFLLTCSVRNSFGEIESFEMEMSTRHAILSEWESDKLGSLPFPPRETAVSYLRSKI